MSLKSIQNQLKMMRRKVEARIEQGHPKYDAAQFAAEFSFHLLTEQERERFQAMADLIFPQIIWQPRGPQVHHLSTEHKDQLESWVVLQQALNDGDDALASRTRRYITGGDTYKQQVYTAFLALDGRCLPVPGH